MNLLIIFNSCKFKDFIVSEVERRGWKPTPCAREYESMNFTGILRGNKECLTTSFKRKLTALNLL